CTALLSSCFVSSFLFHDTATAYFYTLSLHDALPILVSADACKQVSGMHMIQMSRLIIGIDHKLIDLSRIKECFFRFCGNPSPAEDRKSTRLNSSHVSISYAVFCLKKKI